METKNVTKKYTNGEVTIVWQPLKCIHSSICFGGQHGLPEVFKPKERPWIKPEGAATERIIEQIKKCPSGALSFYMNKEEQKNDATIELTTVEPAPNGPLIIKGNILVIDNQGNSIQKSKVTAFCRCGASANKPYCDGTHRKIDFKG